MLMQFDHIYSKCLKKEFSFLMKVKELRFIFINQESQITEEQLNNFLNVKKKENQQ